MNLKQLEAFVQIAEGGSFSKAARELFLTQPTISAHISSLEKELNVRLFIRNTKEVSLSDEGRNLYQYARQIIDLERKIEEEFQDKQKKDVQCITIAASTIPSQYLLPGVLANFSEKYPDEQLKIIETDSSDVIDKIVEHVVDIGFSGTVMEKKHCNYIPFYKDELVVIMPNAPRYQRICQEETTLDWLLTVPVIMREEGSGTRKEAEKQLKQVGITIDNLAVVASIQNSEAIKRSVKSGMGVTIISKLAAQEEIEKGDVLTFPMPSEDGGRDLNLVYNKNYQLSRSAERFVKVVKEMYSLGKA